MAPFPKIADKLPITLALVQTGFRLKSYMDGRGRDEQASQAHEDIKKESTQANLLLTKNNKTLAETQAETQNVLEKGFGIVNKTCPKCLEPITPNVVTAGNSSIVDRDDVRETRADSKKPKQ